MPAHLLIADDEPSVLAILRLFFERLGYRITTARDGYEAVELAQQDLPDLIILDIQMPRMTGLQAVVQLRADPRFADLPIIALTAHVRDNTPGSVIKSGFSRMIIKPFEIVELREIINSYLDRKADSS